MTVSPTASRASGAGAERDRDDEGVGQPGDVQRVAGAGAVHEGHF